MCRSEDSNLGFQCAAACGGPQTGVLTPRRLWLIEKWVLNNSVVLLKGGETLNRYSKKRHAAARTRTSVSSALLFVVDHKLVSLPLDDCGFICLCFDLLVSWSLICLK